jgi:hypothetical protein
MSQDSLPENEVQNNFQSAAAAVEVDLGSSINW